MDLHYVIKYFVVKNSFVLNALILFLFLNVKMTKKYYFLRGSPFPQVDLLCTMDSRE